MATETWRYTYSPPFSRRGARAIRTLEREGGVVRKRSRSHLVDAREALLIFRSNLATTPSAPLRNGIFFLKAQPPLLENGGECNWLQPIS